MAQTRGESPIFLKTHDFVCWLLAHTIRFPKSQRFVMARRVEDAALGFEEQLIRAARAEAGKRMETLGEADVLFEILRRHVRTCVELKLLTPKQYEYATERIVEIGRLLGGWTKKQSGSDRREPAVGAGP